MTPRARKLLLTAHVTCSVGWLGTVAAYLAPAIVGLTSRDPERIRACHAMMQLLGWYVVVPFAIGALVTGVLQSLLTPWGCFRHYWVATKLALTVAGVAILLGHLRGTVDTLGQLGRAAMVDERHLKLHLVVHAAGGLAILVVATVLSIWKPWGKTAYGQRRAT